MPASRMTSNRLHSLALAAQRKDADPFADKAARQVPLDEECEALRMGILSTSQRDRSAAQVVADEFGVDLSVVYRWPAGEIEDHPLRRFCRLQDALIRAKGDDSEAALEPARLIYRRYLAPTVRPGRDAELHALDWMREAAEALGAYSRAVQRPTPEQAREALRQLDDLDRASAQARGVLMAVANGGAGK